MTGRTLVALALGGGACLASFSCVPPLERTPPAVARSDAGLARAQVPDATACPQDAPDTEPPSPLHAELRVPQPRVSRIEDLAVDVTLSNPGTSPVRWLGTYLGAGTLAVEVRDASCQRLPGGPPPTPRADDGVTGWNSLAPGGSLPVAYASWILVDAPPGKYEVRFTGIPGDAGNARVRSAWAPFEVVAAP